MSYADLAKEIAQEIAIGLIPVAGQARDVKDTFFAAKNLYYNQNDADCQFEMITSLLGWIPGPGDGLKAGLRGINRHPELLFDMVRLIMQKSGVYGDAEVWLDSMLGVSRIRGVIKKAQSNTEQYIRDTSWLPNSAIPYVASAFAFVESNIYSLVQVVANKVLHWKKKVPKTTQQIQNSTTIDKKAKAQVKPIEKDTYKKSKTDTAKDGSATTDTKKRTPAFQRIISVLRTADVGVVGEHMADYWVAKELGVRVAHDNKPRPTRKKSDNHVLHQLAIGALGVGIDSIWESKDKMLGKHKSKTYAIIEAKCSGTLVASSPRSLLADNGAKRDRNTTKPTTTNKRGTAAKPTRVKLWEDQQMSKSWINERLLGGNIGIKGQYSRHLVFYGADKAEKHFVALAENPTAPVEANHRDHTPSSEWGDAEIKRALEKRMGETEK